MISFFNLDFNSTDHFFDKYKIQSLRVRIRIKTFIATIHLYAKKSCVLLFDLIGIPEYPFLIRTSFLNNSYSKWTAILGNYSIASLLIPT